MQVETRFTWDPEKAEQNIRKHGVSFEEATEVFGDPGSVVLDNYFIEHLGEQRLQIIGMTRSVTLLLVIFVERDEAGELSIRIISARKATDYEERIYGEQFR